MYIYDDDLAQLNRSQSWQGKDWLVPEVAVLKNGGRPGDQRVRSRMLEGLSWL